MQDFDTLVASLDARGVRESHLQSMLQRIEISFKETVKRNLQLSSIRRQIGGAVRKEEDPEMTHPSGHSVDIDSPSSTVCVSNSDATEPSASFSIELGRNDAEKFDALNRYHDFEKWMWKECINPSILCALKHGKKRCTQLLEICDQCHDLHLFEDCHCPSCHRTYNPLNRNFSEHVAQCKERLKGDPEWSFSSSSDSSPLRIKLLKAYLALIEVSNSTLFLLRSDLQVITILILKFVLPPLSVNLLLIAIVFMFYSGRSLFYQKLFSLTGQTPTGRLGV